MLKVERHCTNLAAIFTYQAAMFTYTHHIRKGGEAACVTFKFEQPLNHVKIVRHLQTLQYLLPSIHRLRYQIRETSRILSCLHTEVS